MKNIGVLTSGGDAPGMNAAIRAVVRTAYHFGITTYGIYKGYQGLIDDEIEELKRESVANIIQRGGTMLKTARCEAFTTVEGRLKAYNNIKKYKLDALIVIGGDGTFRGANLFSKEHKIPVIGIPGTIDNDIPGTFYTIGFDTAVNTAIEAIDKIRDTATAHNRVFVIEVMGRNSGLIALQSGVSCGAEDILVPEKMTNLDELIEGIDYDKRRNKFMRIVVVCEGDDFGGAHKVVKLIKSKFPNIDVKETILGHIQRGGSPTHYDRWMASRFGYEAVKSLLNTNNSGMIGYRNGKMEIVPFDNDHIKYTMDISMLEMAKIISS